MASSCSRSPLPRPEWAAVLILWTCVGASAREPPAYDPAAEKELRLCVDVYQRMPAYSDQGRLELSAKINGQHRSESSPLRLALQRPDKMKLCTGQMRMIVDGERLIAVVDFTRKYTEGKGLKALSSQGLLETPIGPAFLGGTPGLPPLLIISLLADKDPVATILDRTVGLKLLTRDPQICLLIEQKQGPDIFLFLDRKTRQVARIHLSLRPEEYFGRIPSGVTISEMQLDCTPGDKVSQETFAPGTFSYRPDREFKRVNSFAEIFSADQGPGVPIGETARDFTLNAIHRTTPVTRRDLSEKVAILLFWATWSPASFHQLLDALRIVEAHRDQGVVLVAISLDDEEPGKVEEKITALFKEKGIDPQRTPGAILALDPQNTIGLAYQIQSIPTTILIDRQGTVRKHIVGHVKGSANLLDREIETLVHPRSSSAK